MTAKLAGPNENTRRTMEWNKRKATLYASIFGETIPKPGFPLADLPSRVSFRCLKPQINIPCRLLTEDNVDLFLFLPRNFQPENNARSHSRLAEDSSVVGASFYSFN